MTEQQSLTVAVPDAGPPEPPLPAEPRRRRPALRTLLRWGAAALVFGLSGTAAAVAVTAPARSDLPGLGTPSDGRYAFPRLTLPALPSGQPSPYASGNDTGHHFADLRGLLLPVPRGAAEEGGTATRAPSARDCAAEQALFADPAAIKVTLFVDACRRGAARTWTAADGTRTEIRLLGFGSADEAQSFYAALLIGPHLKALPEGTETPVGELPLPYHANATLLQAKGKTAQGAQLVAGDTVATIVMTNPRGVSGMAFRQVVTLQAELLA